MGESLLQSLWPHCKEQRTNMQDKLQTLESVIKDYQNPLDSPITLKELKEKISWYSKQND
jgi:hypothetical protein